MPAKKKPSTKKTRLRTQNEHPEEQARTVKKVFVIMPFTKALGREKAHLDAFFKNNIKRTIEADTKLKYQYAVSRSENGFNIIEDIVEQTYGADVLICDLSGLHANPNVMFELGIRFSLGHKPVILIREANVENEKLFDVHGLRTFEYEATLYGPLEEEIIRKLASFEDNPDSYKSPVLKILAKDPQVISSIMRRQTKGMLRALSEGLLACQWLLRRRLVTLLAQPPQDEATGSQNSDKFLAKPWDVCQFLMNPPENVPPILYSAIEFSPPAIPGMLGYLTFYHFSDSIPQELSDLLYRKLNDLYYNFWAGAHLLAEPTRKAYGRFACEIWIVYDAARAVEAYLESDNEEEKAKCASEAIELLKPAG